MADESNCGSLYGSRLARSIDGFPCEAFVDEVSSTIPP